jgi:hypothetical protein
MLVCWLAFLFFFFFLVFAICALLGIYLLFMLVFNYLACVFQKGDFPMLTTIRELA